MGAGVDLSTIPGLAQQSAGGGTSTGGIHKAVFDAEHRPITAGGSV